MSHVQQADTALSSSSDGLTTESDVDPRLCTGQLPGLTVHLSAENGPSVLAAVRAVTAHDLVLVVPGTSQLRPGDILMFSLYETGLMRAENATAVVHWVTHGSDASLVSLFTTDDLRQSLGHRIIDDRRGEIRFPADVAIQVRVGRELRPARIVNYSLNGVGVWCREPLELNGDYVAVGSSRDGEIRLELNTQWIRKSRDGFLMGCALPPNYGVLMANCMGSLAGGPNGSLLDQISVSLSTDSPVSSPRPAAGLSEASTEFARSGAAVPQRDLRNCLPMFAALPIAASVLATGVMQQLSLLAGLIGVIASLVFLVLKPTATGGDRPD